MGPDRYRELARREAELAERELERSRSAWRYALTQENEGMREHYIRMATQLRYTGTQHEQMAKHFAARADQLARTPEDKTPTG